MSAAGFRHGPLEMANDAVLVLTLEGDKCSAPLRYLGSRPASATFTPGALALSAERRGASLFPMVCAAWSAHTPLGIITPEPGFSTDEKSPVLPLCGTARGTFRP